MRDDYAPRMCHLPRPNSSVFRAALALALLAWTAFAFDAFAHPLAMSGNSAGAASMATGEAASHCEGAAPMNMPHALHHPAPLQPAGNGHGCCHNGGCYCASVCSGIVGVPYLGLGMQPIHGTVFSLIYSQPVRALSAPPLRPPIA